MEILQEEYYFYTLSRDARGERYYLEVVCGTVAIFLIRIKLTPQEIARFRKNPASVSVLAQEILDSPGSFLDRRV